MAGDSVYDSRSVANYMINKSAQHGGLDPLQVLKLIYIAHGFTLAAYDRPLLDDDVEAWKYGPVVRRVYSMLPAGAARITASIPGVAPAVLDDQSRSVVDTVYDKYHPLSGLYLSTLTHKQGSPWAQTWATYGQNAVIPRDLIASHYKKVLSDWQAAVAVNRPYSPDTL